MRTGERHSLVRAVRCFVFWTLRGTTSLCWRGSLTTSHPDRLLQQFWQWCNFFFLCARRFCSNPHAFSVAFSFGLFVSAGILGSRGHRRGVCGLVAWAFQNWPQVLSQQEVITVNTDQYEKWMLVYQDLLVVIHLFLFCVRSSLFYVDLTGGKCGKWMLVSLYVQLLLLQMFKFIVFAASLRAANIRHKCGVLPQAEPRPVSDCLPGMFCLWTTHAVQQALYGKTQ